MSKVTLKAPSGPIPSEWDSENSVLRHRPMSEWEMSQRVKSVGGVKITKDQKQVTFDNGETWRWDSRFNWWALVHVHVPRSRNPDRKSVHTAKWDDCVRDVKRSGSKVSPYAVCSSALGVEGSVRKGHRRGNPTRRSQREIEKFIESHPNISEGFYELSLGQQLRAVREGLKAEREEERRIRAMDRRESNPVRDPAHRKLLRELERHFSMDEKDLKRTRKDNPLPKLANVRAVYYIVSASKGRERFFLKRSGKLTRSAVDAARFRTTKEAVDKAKAHLAKYPASRKFRFDVKLAY